MLYGQGSSSLNSRALFFIGKGVGVSPSSGPNPDNYYILSEGNQNVRRQDISMQGMRK